MCTGYVEIFVERWKRPRHHHVCIAKIIFTMSFFCVQWRSAPPLRPRLTTCVHVELSEDLDLVLPADMFVSVRLNVKIQHRQRRGCSECKFVLRSYAGIFSCVFLVLIFRKKTLYGMFFSRSYSYTIFSTYLVVGNTPPGKRHISRIEHALLRD